ncbi:imelysin family protein [Loktanella sp. SALINAS62]|uniref:imelysin family protein n=1 Tax=Loktanella sp. SALINAS62 TaxID=2706124 RepID=UPI001B8D2B41|nr:imelysin family protein [Loktanella sp. SALINAS62]MBS1302710.1 imelysin family protein [Loktanella sp. SALINAS62]
MIRILVFMLAASPAFADVDAVIDRHVLPRVETFAAASGRLADTPCEVDALKPAFVDAATAWAGMSHLTLGPVETLGRGRSILFWPDTRDATGRGLRLLIGQGETAWTPDAIATASVAARGLGALERLLYERDAQPCDLTLALTADLAASAAAIRDGWTSEFADLMRTAGAPDNTRFLAPEEVEAAFYTSLVTGLEFLIEQRLGAPLNTYDDPRPLRAELRRADLSAPMIAAQIEALLELTRQLGPAPDAEKSLTDALMRARAIDDPSLAGVADPMARAPIAAIQSLLGAARRQIESEIGTKMGITAGFNALDGD